MNANMNVSLIGWLAQVPFIQECLLKETLVVS